MLRLYLALMPNLSTKHYSQKQITYLAVRANGDPGMCSPDKTTSTVTASPCLREKVAEVGSSTETMESGESRAKFKRISLSRVAGPKNGMPQL